MTGTGDDMCCTSGATFDVGTAGRVISDDRHEDAAAVSGGSEGGDGERGETGGEASGEVRRSTYDRTKFFDDSNLESGRVLAASSMFNFAPRSLFCGVSHAVRA